jgi:hypothetical protein
MSEWTREQRRLLRGGIAVLAITPALVGLWATISRAPAATGSRP